MQGIVNTFLHYVYSREAKPYFTQGVIARACAKGQVNTGNVQVYQAAFQAIFFVAFRRHK